MWAKSSHSACWCNERIWKCWLWTYRDLHNKSESCSVVSDSLLPHRLYSPWNSLGQNTGVGSLSLLHGIFPAQGLNPGLPHCRWILYQLSHKGSPHTNGKDFFLKPSLHQPPSHQERLTKALIALGKTYCLLPTEYQILTTSRLISVPIQVCLDPCIGYLARGCS